MARYLARYGPNFSTVTSPLQELLHDLNELRWDDRHTEAFDRMKSMLVSGTVLAYYSPAKDPVCCVTVVCLASELR
jgi:hypothetical protein